MFATAVSASPASLIQARPPFRAGYTSACGAGLRTQMLAHFLVSRAIPNGLVREHESEGGPTYIVNTLGHAGLAKGFRVDVANGDEIEFFGEAVRQFVQSILAAVRNLGVYLLRLPLVLRSLRCGKFGLKGAQVAGVRNLLAGRECGKVFEAQIYAHGTDRCASIRSGNFHHDIQIPVAPSVLIEAGAAADFAFGQCAGIEDAEGVSPDPESIACTPNHLPVQRNPPERLFAAPAQMRTVLAARLRIVLADAANALRMQPKLFAGAACQVDKVKGGRPPLVPFYSLALNIVAVIPNVIHRPRLAIQFTIERFNAVFVGQFHMEILA